MQQIRAFLWLLMGATLLFGANANAAQPQKIFSIAIKQQYVNVGANAFTITVKNETPNGNSNINSVRIYVPTGYVVTGASLPSYIGQVDVSGNTISVSNMSPLKPQATFDINVTVNVQSTTPTCTIATWTAAAWTGSSFSGDTFAQVGTTIPGGSDSTQVSGQQTLAFTSPPGNVTLGESVTMTVKATACGGPVSGLPVQVQITDALGNVVGALSGNTGTDGTASFTIPTGTNQVISTSGTYTITASANGYPPISANVTVYDGVLNCEPTPPFSFVSAPDGVTDPSQSGYAYGQRNRFNKDGSECHPVDYIFINSILTPNPITQQDNTVHLIWDTVTDPYAAFTYTMTWKTEDVDTGAANPNAGWPVLRRPSVAWETLADGVTPKFVAGVACLSPSMPAPYGTLNAPITSASQTTIQIVVPSPLPQYWVTLPSTAASANFPVVVGTERMLVTGVSQVASGPPAIYNLTVQRANGMAATRAGPWPVGQKVMSTPLPVDLNPTSPYFGKQANICVVQHGWTSAGVNLTTGNAQVRYFTTVIDIGDGWVRGF